MGGGRRGGGGRRRGDEFLGEGVFALKGVGDVPAGAEEELFQGGFERGRGAGEELREGFGGPFGDGGWGVLDPLGFESGNDSLDGFGREASVDGVSERAHKDGRFVVREPGMEFSDRGVDGAQPFFHALVIPEF